MRAQEQTLTLASEFPEATVEEWQRLAAGALAGADPETALSSRTEDGLRIKPLYTRRDLDGLAPRGLPGQWPYVRGATTPNPSSGWEVRQRVAGADPAEINRAALAELHNGVDTLWLPTGEHGLRWSDLPRALAGVDLTRAGLVLDDDPASRTAVRSLLVLVREHGVDPAHLGGSLGVDPLGRQARSGTRAELDELPSLFVLARDLPAMSVLTVDGTVYHGAGASPAQELALVTAAGVAYLRTLTDAGLPPEEVFGRVEFRLAVTGEQFPSIAKLRAARLMWSRVAALCGVPQAGAQRQHAVTSPAMLTRHDARTNMLRSAVACVAAVAGGALAITVLPYDAADGSPGDLGQRVARNTHAVLRHEAHLGRVADPAGGSPYVESLTERLAEAAWERFTDIEKAGGLQRGLDNGTIATDVAEAAERRRRAVARGDRPITGISRYAILDDPLPPRRDAAPQPPGGLPEIRYGTEFEALRDRSDAHARRTGERPTVLVVAHGTPARHSRTLDSTRNLFASGGIATTQTVGTLDELAAAVRRDPASAVCVCSSVGDDIAVAAATMRAAGATHIYALSDRVPPADRQHLHEQGVTHFLPVDGDIPALLRHVLNDLEVR